MAAFDDEERRAYEEECAVLMRWLETATPAQWHRVAQHWVWDHGTFALKWIAAQPACERATALLMFWQGDPCYFIEDTPEERERRIANRHCTEDGFVLLAAIKQRWRDTGFPQNTLAFDLRTLWGTRYPVLIRYAIRTTAQTNNPMNLILPDMLAPVAGRELATDEGYWPGRIMMGL